MKMFTCLTAVVAAGLVASPAAAQPLDRDTFIRAGIAHIDLADKGPVFVEGVRDPGADYKTDQD